jgi:hypothetical protein
MAALVPGARAGADCMLVRERAAIVPVPHFALHFGESSEVPRRIRCSTSIDKNLPTLCVPIYAYNLWDGATGFQFAISSPKPPIGFDRGPEIVGVAMIVEATPAGAVTSIDLATNGPVCGPALLGCLRLATSDLPESFQIQVTDHRGWGRCAVRTPYGAWRGASVDLGGARVGAGICPADGCGPNGPIADLRANQGAFASLVDLAWTSGTGNYTLLRYRNDGRYPADPWDGELLAFLPSTVTRYSYSSPLPGTLRIAGWSITRDTHGNLTAASNIECGSLASILVQLPVGVQSTRWGGIKRLYR